MSDLEINRTIHEAMGQRWIVGPGNYMNPVYTCNWDEYGPMLEWAKEQEWWPNFINFGIIDKLKYGGVVDTLLNPRIGSTALAEFIRGRE